MTTASTEPTSVRQGLRRPVQVGVLAILVVTVVWALAVAVTLLLARGNLLVAEQHIGAGQEAIRAMDVDAAAEEFERAADRAATGHRQLRLPHVRAVQAVPVVGDDLRATSDLAEGAADVSRAASDVTGTILAMPGGLDALKPRDGVLPVDAIAELAPPLRVLEDHLRDAIASVSEPARVWMPTVRHARDRFIGVATPALDQVETAAGLAEQLPGFLGADGPRRYLLGAANPAELRGTGGFVGAYAILTFDDGALDIGSWVDVNELPTLSPGALEAPNPDFAARYEQFGGTTHWWYLNMTPDFPSAATAALRLWREVSGDDVDGLIIADPFAFEALLTVAGPVTVQETRVDADNVVDFVANEAYAQFDSHSERKDVIGGVAAAALEGFLGSPDLDDLRTALDPLSAVVSDGHLRIYAEDPGIQAALARVGLDGGLPTPEGDHIGVFVNNAAAAKGDFYVGREIDYTVRLLPDGRASGELEVTFTNHTPSEGLSRHIIGGGGDLEAGQMHGLVSVFCAPRCEYSDAPSDHHGPARVSEELGLPVVDTWVTVDSGGQERLRYSWTTADAWHVQGGALVYHLSFNDQVTIRPTSIRVRLMIPEGFVPQRLPDDASVDGSAVIWERTDARGDTDITLRLTPAD